MKRGIVNRLFAAALSTVLVADPGIALGFAPEASFIAPSALSSLTKSGNIQERLSQEALQVLGLSFSPVHKFHLSRRPAFISFHLKRSLLEMRQSRHWLSIKLAAGSLLYLLSTGFGRPSWPSTASYVVAIAVSVWILAPIFLHVHLPVRNPGSNTGQRTPE